MNFGKKTNRVDTLVESKTWYTIPIPLRSQKNATTERKAYTKAFQTIPAELKSTLTYDKKKEMIVNQRFTIDKDI